MIKKFSDLKNNYFIYFIATTILFCILFDINKIIHVLYKAAFE